MAIVTVLTAAAGICSLLGRSDPGDPLPPEGSWNVELWNIAQGYRVNYLFPCEAIVGRDSLFSNIREAGTIQMDVTVSRQHCMLYEQGDGLYVWNLSTVNPTAVNGYRLTEPQRLVPGDRLELGNSTFLVTRVDYK